ncbi:hypothetical protein TNCV_1457861 [Trichonephila clavipes]|nr:hypothetical protein TNCV_1457861 [Trichonephila clavipes]
MALRNKDSAMNKMSRCRTRNLAPVHSRRGREREREETEKGKKRDERERGDGKREEKESGERGAGLGWRKGLSPKLKWKDDERRWR